MNRIIAGALTGFVVFATFEMPRASAQPQVPVGPSRPVFSPYLNLLNGGNPALNYFGLVVPQMQMQQQLGQLQQQQLSMSGGISQQATPTALYPPTGSVPVFNTTYGYFNRVYVGGGAGGGGGGAGGGSFNRMGGAASGIGGIGGQGAAGFQRGATGTTGATSPLQPSFAAPMTRPPAGGGFNQPPR
jgi:hypothetical protein